MSDENTAKALARELGERQVTTTAPCRKSIESNTDETHVLESLDIFFSLRGDAAHFPQARSWNYIYLKKRIHPLMFWFQFLVLLVETGSEGSLRPAADRNEQPAQYKETVRLAAEISMGKASVPDRNLFKTRGMTIADHLVDHVFLHDVENAKREIRHENFDKKQAGKTQQKKNATRAKHKLPNAEWVNEMFLDSSSTERPVLRGLTNFYKAIAKLAPSEVASSSTEEGAAAGTENQQQQQAPQPAFVPDPFPEDHPKITPKVTMTVTAIPRQGGDPAVHEDVVGIYVRFLIRDPNLNTGTFFTRIMNNLANRKSSVGMRGPQATPDLFMNYASLFYSEHPAGNKTSRQTYYRCACEYVPALRKDGDKSESEIFNSMNIVDRKDNFHLSRILTTQRAVQAMSLADADYAYTTIGIDNTYWDPVAKVARFPPKSTTYKYNSIGVFWSHPVDVGLSEQYFPHISMDADFLAILVSGGSMKDYFEAEDAQRETDQVYNDVQQVLGSEWRVERKAILENKLVDYHTNNEFVHRAAEAGVMNKRIMQLLPSHYRETLRQVQELVREHGSRWRQEAREHGTHEFDKRIAECELYNKVLEKAQMSCVKTFCGLWQLEGNVDDLCIPGPIKIMLKWYRDNQKTKLPNMTREYTLWDPDLGFFGNSILKQLTIFSGPARILQPLLCLLTEGLYSTYHWAPRKLCFNLLAHGRYGVGKTYPLITIPAEFACIQGTITEYSTSTAAADTTQKHAYDEIIAADEVPEWKVNKLEAKKNIERVNKEKIKMTSKKVEHKVFSNEKTATGENVRWARTIRTDHYVALIEVTNAVVEAKEALSSRYHRVTVPQPPVPSRELTGPVGAAINQDAKLYLNINQFMSAAAYKMSMCGGMLEDAEMQLFKDVSNRVLNYLVHRKAIDKDVCERGLEIMEPYVRQLVYHMGIHYAFDMPCSPHYMKEFEPSMLRDMQPYLYVTTEIIWWAWTTLACGWIEENNSNVLRAVMKVAGVNWDDAETPYQHYEADIGKDGHKFIPFRERLHKGEQCIDLHYITLEGPTDQLFSLIAMETCPKLSTTDVAGVMYNLSKHAVRVPRGGYAWLPVKAAAEWHKFTQLPDPENPANLQGTKNVGNAMPQEFRTYNPDVSVPRRQDDWPTYGDDPNMFVVDMCEAGIGNNKRIHVMPGVAHLFQAKTIVEALVNATVSKTFRPGKMLLGLPEEEDARVLKTFTCPQAWVDHVVSELDEKEGWVRASDGTLCWTGNPEVPENERPVSRREGIQFNRRGGMSDSEARFFTEVPTAPVREGCDEWKRRCENDIETMQAVRDVIEDLDYESAVRRHIKCGRPLDEPVRSQEWIREQYNRACRDMEKPIHRDMDYPHDVLAEMQQKNIIWNTANVSKNAVETTSKFTNMGFERYNVARKASTRAVLDKAKKAIAAATGKKKRVEREVEYEPEPHPESRLPQEHVALTSSLFKKTRQNPVSAVERAN